MAPNETPLESWKAIAAHLQKDITTVRRWEKQESLPVHRHNHNNRSSVYAYRSEIDAWRTSRKESPEPPPPLPLWKTLLAPPRSLAFGVTLALCLMMVGNGIRPQTALAQDQKAARLIWQEDQSDGSGTVSADGRYLSFTDMRTGDLGIRDLLSNTTRLLTNTGGWDASGDYAERSTISPDGKQVAYLWFMANDKKDELRIAPVNGDGPPRTVLTSTLSEYMEPWGWTPDGKQLLVIKVLEDHTSQITMVTAADGSMRVLKSLNWQYLTPQLSPDGRLVAFDAPGEAGEAPTDVFVLATDGSSETRVVRNPGNDFAMGWSSDGSRILFLSDRSGSFSLWSQDIMDGKPQGSPELIKADTGRISPLGTAGGTFYYWYSPGNFNIYSVALGPDGEADGKPELVSDRNVNHVNGPALSRDGKFLAYYYVSGRQDGDRLIIRTLDTGDEREIALPWPAVPQSGAGPMWFPDNRTVLITMREPKRPGYGFFRVDLATGQPELVRRVTDVSAFNLSPDGASIFYVDSRDEWVRRLVRFDLDTGRETEIRGGEHIMSFALSPDGKQLAYLMTLEGESKVVNVMPAAGGSPREVLSGPISKELSQMVIAWTPDQRDLLVQRRARDAGPENNFLESLWRIPLDDGPPQPLGITMHTGAIRSPQILPDGRQIIFWANGGNDGEVWKLENFLPNLAVSGGE